MEEFYGLKRSLWAAKAGVLGVFQFNALYSGKHTPSPNLPAETGKTRKVFLGKPRMRKQGQMQHNKPDALPKPDQMFSIQGASPCNQSIQTSQAWSHNVT
jgi:hypothetical protein